MTVILNTREVQGFVVLDISGRLTILDESLRDTVGEFLQAGKRQFILKMNDLSYMDSCGLGQLVSVYISVRNADGNLRLLSPGKKCRELLRISKLDTVFDIFEDAAPFEHAAKGTAITNGVC
jgi:anti-anti-sigma factor